MEFSERLNSPRLLINAENVTYLLGGRHFLGDAIDLVQILSDGLSKYAQAADISLGAGSRKGYWPTLQIVFAKIGSGRLIHSVRIEKHQTAETDGPLVLFGRASEAETHETVLVDLRYLLWNSAEVRGSYTVYGHVFGTETDVRLTLEQDAYIGITRRGIATRWIEHLTAARRGSIYRFHSAIRESLQYSPVTHWVIAAGLSFDEAMNFEEKTVEMYSLAPRGLNMIPGGHAGLKFLASARIPTTGREWMRRDRHVNNVLRTPDGCSALASARWDSGAYAARVICGNPRNFSHRQIIDIRAQSMSGIGAGAISTLHECRPERVRRLLSDLTYRRVKGIANVEQHRGKNHRGHDADHGVIGDGIGDGASIFFRTKQPC